MMEFMIKQYYVVSSYALHKLVEEVNQRIRQGDQPFAGLFYEPTPGEYTEYKTRGNFCQIMVRYEPAKGGS
jgi:hypothetical protein